MYPQWEYQTIDYKGWPDHPELMANKQALGKQGWEAYNGYIHLIDGRPHTFIEYKRPLPQSNFGDNM